MAATRHRAGTPPIPMRRRKRSPPYRPGGAYSRTATTGATTTAANGGPPPTMAGPAMASPITRRATTIGRRRRRPAAHEGYSQNEIIEAGHRFFGSVSKGLASVVEYAFQKQGRPNGYILGEDAGGAFVAVCATARARSTRRDAGNHKFTGRARRLATISAARAPRPWFSSTTFATHPQIYERYGGVQGSAYLVGGVGIQYPDARQCDAGAHPVGDWAATRCERRIFEVYPLSNVESVLSRRRVAFA